MNISCIYLIEGQMSSKSMILDSEVKKVKKMEIIIPEKNWKKKLIYFFAAISRKFMSWQLTAYNGGTINKKKKMYCQLTACNGGTINKNMHVITNQT